MYEMILAIIEIETAVQPIAINLNPTPAPFSCFAQFSSRSIATCS